MARSRTGSVSRAGWVISVLGEATAALADVEKLIKSLIMLAHVVHVDETEEKADEVADLEDRGLVLPGEHHLDRRLRRIRVRPEPPSGRERAVRRACPRTLVLPDICFSWPLHS